MLKAIIKEKHVDGLLRFEALAFRESILVNPEGDATLEAELHQLDFIACAIRTLIATAEDGNALSVREKFLSEPDYHGGLAGASNGEVAYADHRSSQPFLFQPATGI